MKNILLIFLIAYAFTAKTQIVFKENLTEKDKLYWDFKKTKIQSTGSYYKDILGETRDKHGKWEFYNEFGDIEEIRNYYREKLNGQVFLKFANGKPRQEGYFKLDKQDSIYREWVENGTLVVEGKYKNGKPFGIWRKYYMDGKEQSVEEYLDTLCMLKEFWKDDSLHTRTIKNGTGIKTTFYPNGKVKEFYNYKDGLRDGIFEERSINGYLFLTGFFKQERKEGEWRCFYYTGDLEKISNYKNGLLDGAYSYYYDTKVLNVSGNYVAGKKEGKWFWYTNKGGKDMEGTFVNNMQDGDWIYYYPTGEVSYNAFYKQDKREGKWEYYYENKKLFKVGTYANDLKDGLWETWYEDGTLLMTGKYVKGKEEGIWKNFWPNTTLKNQSTFKKGYLHGQWYSYAMDGTTTLTGFYKEGYKTGKWTKYYDNRKVEDINTYKIVEKAAPIDYGFAKGRKIKESVRHGFHASYSMKDYALTEEGHYINDEKDGKWVDYLPGGLLPAVITNYKEGKLEGLMIQYGRRSEKISESEYKNGVKEGKFRMFDVNGKIILEKTYSKGQEVRR